MKEFLTILAYILTDLILLIIVAGVIFLIVPEVIDAIEDRKKDRK